MPELPEMEIVARRLAEALPGQTIESVLTPGMNALKTFDPPLSALDGATFTTCAGAGSCCCSRPRPRARPLTLLHAPHDAGRLMPIDSAARCATRPRGVHQPLPDDRELAAARVRDQAGGVG